MGKNNEGNATEENNWIISRDTKNRGIWVAQSVKCPALAQVMISRSVSSSPTSSPVLPAQSLEPASDSVSPSLSARVLSLSLSQKITNIKRIFKNNNIKDILKTDMAPTKDRLEVRVSRRRTHGHISVFRQHQLCPETAV